MFILIVILKELFDTCIIQGIIQETETILGVSTRTGLWYRKFGAYRIIAGVSRMEVGICC